MKIKNVSSTNIELPEFNIKLGPGEVEDLSKFDSLELARNQKLNILFEKGLLLNLGNSIVRGSTEALKSARQQIEKLGLKDYIEVPKKQTNRPKPSERPKNNRKQDKSTLRYSEEYIENKKLLDPNLEEISKPRPKIQEKFQTMNVNIDGTISEFGSYGVIQSEILTGKTTALNPEIKKKIKDPIVISDTQGNEFCISKEIIMERLKRKCLGFSDKGKPCKKWAVNGFETCLTHMTKIELEQYEKNRRELK